MRHFLHGLLLKLALRNGLKMFILAHPAPWQENQGKGFAEDLVLFLNFTLTEKAEDLLLPFPRASIMTLGTSAKAAASAPSSRLPPQRL